MIFKSKQHQEKYEDFLSCMKIDNAEHRAVAYLLAFDHNISDNEGRLASCFDFAKDSIKPNVLEDAWVTGSDRRILSLAFHLWNGFSNSFDILDLDYFNDEDIDCLVEAIRIRLGRV